MKKTFLTRRNALLSSGELSWGGIGLLFAILALLVRLIAPNFFFTITTPVFRLSNTLAESTHLFFSSFGTAAALTARNEQLEEENAALASQNAALIQKEAALMGLAGAASKLLPSTTVAGVVARPPLSPYDTLVVDRGSRSGVSVGQEAFGQGGTPIGVVTSTKDDFSRITLFSAPGMTVLGSVGRGALPIALVGVGGGAVSASLARSSEVSVGDVVSVLGPGALPIGTVVRIESDPSSPSITLQIQLSTNLFSIAWVSLRDAGTALARMPLVATSTVK